MNNWKKYIPEGMRDLLFKECITKIEIQNKLREIYLSSGFEEIISPTIEFYDVFNSENQPMEQEKMYKLFDSQGRILVLKPDMTTPIARIVGTKLNNRAIPLKLCYTSNIFRINEKYNGKLNEITQSGIEVIGIKSPRADIEVIITAVNALLEIGLKNFKIEIGHVGFFKGICEDLNLNEVEFEKLRELIENKNFAGLNYFLQDNISILGDKCYALSKIPALFGDEEILEQARTLTDNKTAQEAIEGIKSVYSFMKSIGLSDYITIDLGMVQHINYYTGIIFRGYCTEVGNNVLSGGRYDNLVERFGEAMPATGLAINVDNILLSLINQGEIKNKNSLSFLVYYDASSLNEAYSIAIKIRKRGFSAELSPYEEIDSALNYARSKSKDYFVEFRSKSEILLTDFSQGTRVGENIDNFIDTLGEF